MRTAGDQGYAQTAQHMLDLAAHQPGFLGVEHARNPDGFGITVSYWDSMEAIARWKAQGQHAQAQVMGKTLWYGGYEVHIAKVERAYGASLL